MNLKILAENDKSMKNCRTMKIITERVTRIVINATVRVKIIQKATTGTLHHDKMNIAHGPPSFFYARNFQTPHQDFHNAAIYIKRDQ